MIKNDAKVLEKAVSQIVATFQMMGQILQSDVEISSFASVWSQIYELAGRQLEEAGRMENMTGCHTIYTEYVKELIDTIQDGISRNDKEKVQYAWSELLTYLTRINNLYGEFEKEWDIMKIMRVHVYENFQRKYDTPYVTVGDFTYGIPEICDYKEGIRVSIGKFCSIAKDVSILLGGEHNTKLLSCYPFNFRFGRPDCQGHPRIKGDIVIGNDVWIGAGATILSGVTIGDGCVIGAGAVVQRDMPAYCIAGGVPAQVIRKRFDEGTIAKLETMQWWDWEDEKLYGAMPLIMQPEVKGLWEYYENSVRGKE